MAIKQIITCDKCGKELEPDKRFDCVITDPNDNTLKDVDLCLECSQAIIKVISFNHDIH